MYICIFLFIYLYIGNAYCSNKIVNECAKYLLKYRQNLRIRIVLECNWYADKEKILNFEYIFDGESIFFYKLA